MPLATLFWVATVVCSLLFLRAYELDRFNAGWGDPAADRKHALLWYALLSSIGVSVAVGILLLIISRTALHAITISISSVLLLGLIGHYGPHPLQVIVFVPQFPGYLAAVFAFGVHDSSGASTTWAVTTNALIYAVVAFAILRYRKARPK